MAVCARHALDSPCQGEECRDYIVSDAAWQDIVSHDHGNCRCDGRRECEGFRVLTGIWPGYAHYH